MIQIGLLDDGNGFWNECIDCKVASGGNVKFNSWRLGADVTTSLSSKLALKAIKLGIEEKGLASEQRGLERTSRSAIEGRTKDLAFRQSINVHANANDK